MGRVVLLGGGGSVVGGDGSCWGRGWAVLGGGGSMW